VDPLPGDVTQERAAAWSAGGARTRTSLVYLARHGQTESNLQCRYAGYSDEPITPAGRAQMSVLASRLARCGVAEIWTSEVSRARESAEMVGRVLGAPIRTDPRLNEMRMGPWEGMTEDEVARAFPTAYARWCALPDQLVLDGRETLHDIAARVGSAMNDASHQPHPVLLMTHVAPIRVAVLSVLGLHLSQYKRLHMGNGDGVVIDRSPSDARRLGEKRSLLHEFPVSGPERSIA
jgi:broad specificity phosphatase PhoE